MSEPDDEYRMDAPDPAKGAYPDPDRDECPVIPLGFEGGRMVFALPEGELRFEPAAKIAGMLKTDIFVSIEGQVFLSFWKDEEGKFSAQAAAIWFNRQCRAAGKWDRNRPVRGLGLWPSDEGPVLHAGDALGYRIGGKKTEWVPIAQALRKGGGGPVWRLAPPMPRPKAAAGADIGEAFRRKLDRWRWRPIGPGSILTGADVVAGWQMMAMMGACPSFRAHLMLQGGAGTGKTTLMRLLQAMGSANAGDLLDSFSEAGLRGALSGEARAVYLDEAEPSPDGQGPIEKALELLRRMTTGEGSNRRQGDMSGGVQAQTAVGAAALGSIYPVQLGEAMATRAVEVKLALLGAAKGGDDDALEAERLWAKEHSPALLARGIAGLSRYRSDVSLLKAAMGEMMGSQPRAADLVASLAAGRRLLLFDEPLTAEAARDEVELWAPLVDAREVSATTQNPGQACLARLFSMNSGKHERDRHLTVGEMITDAAVTPGFYDKELKALGLKVENQPPNGERPGPWLIVANKHPTLERGFQGTQYQNWRGVLEHLADLGDDHAPRPMPAAVRFGLVQSRALAVPLTPWLERPVAVGVARDERTPFDEPDWDGRFGSASRPASHGETHDQ